MTRPLQLCVPEDAFQATVVEFAQLNGWKVCHFRPGRTAGGWKTAVAADGAGFPDLVMARERVVFAELKSTTGRLRPAQRSWLEALRRAGAEAYCWYPTCWPEIETVLSKSQPKETTP